VAESLLHRQGSAADRDARQRFLEQFMLTRLTPAADGPAPTR
jgi:hypothetical protein